MEKRRAITVYQKVVKQYFVMVCALEDTFPVFSYRNRLFLSMPLCCFISSGFQFSRRPPQSNWWNKSHKALVVACQRRASSEIVFVGAGPGGKEWLTWAAIKELRKAQVVLYDYLVNKEILKLCNKQCEKISVGKAIHGSHEKIVLQKVLTSRYVTYVFNDNLKDIHDLLEYYYRKGKYIIRLKGGDPGIFGRLAEEIDCVKVS